jgi:undecaprenyl-diphosphatase
MIIDTATYALMQLIENQPLTILSIIISYALEPINLVILGLLIGLLIHIKISKKKGIFFASTMLATGILIKVFKEIFQRARPLDGIITETSFSMPSGHATIAVVFFGLIAYLFTKPKHKTKTILITSLVILVVAFTRIYLRVHWLTDVVAGLFLGGIILITSIIIYKKL